MKQDLTEEEIRELERQLSCPSGEKGIELGKNMNETNIGMISRSIDFLGLNDNDTVLELGHGNCGHLKKIIETAKEITYYGLEISKTMCDEAKNTNLTAKRVNFALYNGKEIPYKDKFFDKTISVNTIYFWKEPTRLIKEIERVLKPKGICVLTYGDRAFMQQLPFVGKMFKLYGTSEIQALVEVSNLRIIEFNDRVEQVTSKAGESIERKYTMVKLIRL